MRSLRPIAATLLCLALGCSSTPPQSGDGDLPTANQDLRGGASDDQGGGGAPDLATPVTEGQACAAYAQAQCGVSNRCVSFSFTIAYGDMATCVARYQRFCQGWTTLTGATVKPATITSCAAAISGESCDDYLTGNAPASCRFNGTLATGAACGSGVQCQSGYCTAGAGSCGACATRPGLGAACTVQTLCDSGLYCSGTANRTCARYGALGATCSVANNILCGPTLSCQNGQCATPLATGAACNQARDGYYGGCDGNQGVFCNNSKCTAVSYVTAGQSCPAGTYCSRSSCFNSKCVAQAADNAACDSNKGPICMAFAGCLANRCTVLDPSTCR